MIYFIAIVVLLLFLVGFSFLDFAVKSESGLRTDSGGILFVEGDRTYYKMPNGTRRKLADYPMDLTPGSKDMAMFLSIMDKAKKESHEEAVTKKREAVKNMQAVARDS